MKIVVNRCFGGFSLSKSCAEKLGVDIYPDDSIRVDNHLIKMVEDSAIDASGSHAKLVVVEIPDRATDWKIFEYDGAETIIAVVDGKINEF